MRRDLAFLALLAATLGLGAWTATQEVALREVMEQYAPEGMPTGIAGPTLVEIREGGAIVYSAGEIEAIREGRDEVIESIADQAGLSPEERVRLRSLMADHMARLNEIVAKERAGIVDHAGAITMTEAERVHRLEALVELLGSERASAVEQLVRREWESRQKRR